VFNNASFSQNARKFKTLLNERIKFTTSITKPKPQYYQVTHQGLQMFSKTNR